MTPPRDLLGPFAFAAARESYTMDDVTYTREIIASAPDGIIAIHLSTDRPAAFVLRLGERCLTVSAQTGYTLPLDSSCLAHP